MEKARITLSRCHGEEGLVRKYYTILFTFLILLFSVVQIDAQTQIPSKGKIRTRHKVDYPEVPRVSAYEAYFKYKAGKAIIIQAGGEKYERRHILGAFNIDQEAVRKGQIKLPKFPKKGIEIFTYCY